MSATMMTTENRQALQPMAGGQTYASAWPVRRDADLTLYRCRMWDGIRASDPFLLRAPHGFLGADPVVVLSALAATNEDALSILRRAGLRGRDVEFNQETQGNAVVAQALARLAPGTAVQ